MKTPEHLASLTNQPELDRLVKNLQKLDKIKEKMMEAEKGTFSMIRELWGTTPPDCRLALIGEFIFYPNELKTRYHNERNFQRNLKNRWKK